MEDGQVELSRRLKQRGFQPPVAAPRTASPTAVSGPAGVPGEAQPVAGNLYFIHESFCLTDPIHFARFRERSQALRPSLVVIDTAAEALDIRDWINRSEILQKIAPIRRLARDLCTVLLIAHNRKAEGSMGDEIAGSNALAGAVDGWISAHKVERRENGNRRLYLRIEGRGGVGHELIAEMDHKTLHFHLVPAEQVELDAAENRSSVYIARRQERHALAREMFQARGGSATIAEIAAAMGVSYKVAWTLVREMAEVGAIKEIRAEPGAESTALRVPAYRLCQS